MMNWIFRAGKPGAATTPRGMSNTGASKAAPATRSRRVKLGVAMDVLIFGAGRESTANGAANLVRGRQQGSPGDKRFINFRRERPLFEAAEAQYLPSTPSGPAHHVAQTHLARGRNTRRRHRHRFSCRRPEPRRI